MKICCCFAYHLHSKQELRKATRCHSESFLFQLFYSQSTNFISVKKVRLFFAMNSQVHAKNLQLQRQRLEVHTYIRSRAYFYFANFHREKRASRSQIYNKNTYGNRKVSNVTLCNGRNSPLCRFMCSKSNRSSFGFWHVTKLLSCASSSLCIHTRETHT